jgi:SAM-dependent methyltransferase
VTHDFAMPSAWVARWSDSIPPGGKVLDLACGHGRHARLFAGLGHEVVAVDRDAEALASLAGIARVRTRQANLEDGSPWPFGTGVFSGVVVTNYLHRPLFAGIRASLAPGGVLLYETFMAGNERYGKPSNPRFLLQAGELWREFGAKLEVTGFEQGFVAHPKPAIIQRLCAKNAPFR